MKRSRRVRRVTTKRMPWGDPFDRLFARALLLGTPPSEVLIRMGPRTWTYVADFANDDGPPWRCTIKIDPVRMVVISEDMTVSFKVAGDKRS